MALEKLDSQTSSDIKGRFPWDQGKWLKRLVWFLMGYTALCVGLSLGQQRLMFWPTPELQRTPNAYGLAYEDVWVPIVTSEGTIESLHGWWILAEDPSEGVILYFHHNAINISANVSQAAGFQGLGYTVFLVNYRGYGLSEGKFPEESQLYEDGAAAWQYVVEERQIPPQNVIIYGHSFGIPIAVDLATQQPKAGALILQNAFTNIKGMAHRFGLHFLFPVDLLLSQEFDSLAKIDGLEMPVLLIHGVKDPQVPVKMSQVLFAAAPEPKQLMLLPESGHDNHMDGKTLTEIDQFIQSHICKNQDITVF
jgi:pimeloyl-ACP methyl ester carboxylesterase